MLLPLECIVFIVLLSSFSDLFHSTQFCTSSKKSLFIPLDTNSPGHGWPQYPIHWNELSDTYCGCLQQARYCLILSLIPNHTLFTLLFPVAHIMLAWMCKLGWIYAWATKYTCIALIVEGQKRRTDLVNQNSSPLLCLSIMHNELQRSKFWRYCNIDGNVMANIFIRRLRATLPMSSRKMCRTSNDTKQQSDCARVHA